MERGGVGKKAKSIDKFYIYFSKRTKWLQTVVVLYERVDLLVVFLCREIYNLILIFLNSPIFDIRQILLFSLRNYIADFVIKHLSTCADANNCKVIKAF